MSHIKQLILIASLMTMQACHAVMETSPAPEQPAALPSILAPMAPPAQAITLEAGLEIRSQFDKIRIKNLGGADQSLSQALDLKKTTIIALVKPGCIYCESLLAVLDGKRYKGKANIVFVLDAVHANQEEFKKKAKEHKKAASKWFYDYGNKFSDIYGITSFPQFIVVGKDGKVIKYQKGLVIPENRESLSGLDHAVILQTLSRSTVSWLEQY